MHGSTPVGGLMAGVLGETLGTRAATFAGAALLAVSIVPMLDRRIRTLAEL